MAQTDLVLYRRACKVIPTGVGTYSKMPDRFGNGFPIYSRWSEGPYVWDSRGEGYIDMASALGAVILGHNNKYIRQKIRQFAGDGEIMSLTHPKVVELAERLVSLIPCAEQVRFLTSGSEATTAAVKIARAYTNRDLIITFKDHYHGWHPWFSYTQPKSAGSGLAHTVSCIEVDKLFTLRAAPAAVIMEPARFEALPLEAIRKWCTQWAVVLIFDEVVTGFRYPGGSAQKHFGVTPDLACFGKALTNGMAPFSFVCGKKELMQVIEKDCFISSTYAESLTAITAAMATLDVLESEKWPIWDIGREILKDLPVKHKGFPCRFMLDVRREFLVECCKRGLLIGPHLSIFPTLAHRGIIDKIKEIINKVASTNC